MTKNEVLEVLLALALIAAGVFIYQGCQYGFDKIFAPRQSQLAYEVQHNSQAYNDGVAKDLNDMHLRYVNPKTTPDEKKVLEGMVMDRISNYDLNKLNNTDLRGWVQSIVAKKSAEKE